MTYLIAGNDPSSNIAQLKFLTTFDLNTKDYIIILGNTGLPEDNLLEFYKTLPFNILFLEGLHDNTKMLYSMDVLDWQGGKVHKLTDNVYHLIRSYIFNIDNKSVFVMGGDVTYNNDRLVEDIDYYSREAPDRDELELAVKNLTKVSYKIHYILSTIPDSKTMLQFENDQSPSDLSNWLYDISNKLVYDRWYFGRYPESIDRDFYKCTGIGEGIIPLGLSVQDIMSMSEK